MISSLKLARLCGVSQGTVDRALHDRTGISEATRRRILKAAAKHGYFPNPAARELMTGQSRMVGALVPAINSVFFMDLMNAVKEALAARGLRLLLTTVNTTREFHEVLDEFAARRMKAAVVVPPEEGLRLSPHVTRDMKVVSLLSPVSGEKTVCFVAPDEVATGREAVRYLAAQGHRQILHLTYHRDAMGIRDRARGYEKAMRALGSTPMVLREVTAPTLENALETFRPTALFCHNDPLAMTAIRLMGELGRRVPQGISVLGVDSSPTFRTLYPDLATMTYPREAVAAEAAAWIAGARTLQAIPPCRIVEGKTIMRVDVA